MAWINTSKWTQKLYKLWMVTLGWGFYSLNLLPRSRKRSRSKQVSNGELKILEINTFENTGGAAKHAYRLMQCLRRRDVDISMLVSHIIPEHGDHVEILQPNTSPLQKKLFEFEQRKHWVDYFHLSSLTIPSSKRVKDSSIVHLHNIHGVYFSPFTLPALSAAKPTLWTMHDTLMLYQDFEGREPIGEMDPHKDLPKPALDQIRKDLARIYRNSHLHIVAPSLWMKQKVENSILGGHPVTFLRYGIDLNLFRPTDDKQALRRQLGLPLDKKILVFAAYGGSANGWKGGSYLEEAYRHFQSDPNIVFLNLGGKGINEGNANWINTDFIAEEQLMRDYFAASDLMVYPSLFDNCPFVVMEALACGIPVISFRTGGIPELVEHGKTGYIAEYRDAQDLIAGTKLFLENPELLRSAGLSARVRAESEFDIEAMGDKYMQLYAEVSTKFYSK